MEYSMAAIGAGEWSSLISGMYTTDEADFMAQLLNNSPLSDHDGTSNLGFPSTFWPSDNATSYSFSQESYCLSDSNAVFVANSSKNSSMSMDFCMEDSSNTSSFLVEPDEHCLNQEILGSSELGNVERVAAKLNQQHAAALPKVETAKMSRPEPITETKNNNGTENSSKKRCRSSGDINQKNKRNARSKKKQLKSNSNKEDGINGGSVNVQSSVSCLSEDDSNASQELNGGVSSSSTTALNFNGKTRASRGAATDPQSLYARKRRDRINERLRILQNLVPNGTKVDISTMLEEAVQYVKFLQLQIKLLSSEDLWMYAPIAYNGMDIGLDIKVGTSKRS